MRKAHVDDEVLLLDRRQAVHRYFDEANGRTLARLCLVFTAVAIVYAISLLAGGAMILGSVAIGNAVFCGALFRARQSAAVETRVRSLTVITVVGQYLLFVAYGGGHPETAIPWGVMLPMTALLVRFDAAELLLLLGGLVGVSAVAPVVLPDLLEPPTAGAPEGSAGGSHSELLISSGIVAATVFFMALLIARRHRRRFLRHWESEKDRHQDRLRMKQELEHARDIQLSMLPDEGPTSGWLDFASLSLPATEVGGDYYDYFPLDDDRLAVVVADVAGHGVASGLVLSGVRSGLNMLDDSLAVPGASLERLNRMVRRTTPRKMLVSMLICVFDEASRTVRFGSAGHPPPLLVRAGGSHVVELTSGSLPLGTRDDIQYPESESSLAAGDVLLLHTDGLAETVNEAGEPYGYERLRSALADAAGRDSAGEARESLLQSLWSFKGHASQIDDVTLVLLKVRGGQA